jgi:pimeloyl-ACP methyl ester carboxylesterase
MSTDQSGSTSSGTRRVRREVKVEDITLAVDIHEGNGTPILLLHGIPGDRSTWAAVAANLAERGRTVIAPDLVGFGDSADSAVPLHAREQAKLLKELVKTIGLGKVHLVGFDFGGPTTIHLAALLGGKASSIVLSNTNVFPDTPVPLPLRIASVPVLGDLAYRVFFSRAGLAMLWFPAVQRRQELPFATFCAPLGSAKTVRTTRRIFLKSLSNLESLYAPVQRLAEDCRVPALVIWSDRDPFFPATVGERTAAAVRGKLRVLRCGHFTPLERSAEFAQLVLDHVESVETGASAVASVAPVGRERGSR